MSYTFLKGNIVLFLSLDQSDTYIFLKLKMFIDQAFTVVNDWLRLL